MNENRFTASLIALLVAGIVFGAMLRLPSVFCVNDASRWDTVWSLLNGRGYVLDYKWDDGKFEAPYDLFMCDQVRKDGKFYSSKPPLLPTVAAGIAWAVRATTGMQIPERDDVVNRLVLLLINVIPLAIAIILYAGLLERLGYGAAARLFCISAAAFGTYITAYSVTFNNHTVAACACLYTLYCLIRVKYEGRTEARWFVWAGLFAAWTAANEMPGVLFALMVFGWMLYGHARQTLKFFVVPAAIVGGAYLLTTYLQTGGFVPFQVNRESPLYYYPGSHWLNPEGIDAANDPKWLYLVNLLIGHHGVFSLTPVFLISFYGMLRTAWLRLRNVEDKGPRTLPGVEIMGLVLSVVLIVFYLFRTSNYGGGAQGFRWLFWLTPFWLISLAPVVDRHINSRAFRVFAFTALAISLMTVGYALSGRMGPWGNSWLMNMMYGAGWMGY